MWNWLFWALKKGRPSAGGSHMSGVWGRKKPRQRFWVLTFCFGQSALSSTGLVYPSHRRQALLCCYYPTTEKSYENKNVLDSWQCFFNVWVCLSWKQIQVQNKIFFSRSRRRALHFFYIIKEITVPYNLLISTLTIRQGWVAVHLESKKAWNRRKKTTSNLD